MNCDRQSSASAFPLRLEPQSLLIIHTTSSEEMAEDVRSRMRAIQDEEISQLRELTAFLDLELHFATQYADVLKNAKAEWCTE